MCLDEAAQQFEKSARFLTRERRQNAFLRGDAVGPQVITQRLAAPGEPESSRPAVGWTDPPFDIARGSQAIDNMMGGYWVDAETRSKRCLLDVRHFLERGDHGPFDWRQSRPLRHLSGDAQTHLVEASRQMRRDAVTFGNGNLGLGHARKVAPFN